MLQTDHFRDDEDTLESTPSFISQLLPDFLMTVFKAFLYATVFLFMKVEFIL